MSMYQFGGFPFIKRSSDVPIFLKKKKLIAIIPVYLLEEVLYSAHQSFLSVVPGCETLIAQILKNNLHG